MRNARWFAGLALLACAATPLTLAAADEAPTPAELNAEPLAAPQAGAVTPDTAPATDAGGGGENFDFFSDAPIESTEVVELPPEKSRWLTVGGPIALFALFFGMLVQIWWLVPFDSHSIDLNLRDLPPAAKRGIAMAVGMFGVAFCFGAAEIW